MLALNNAPDIIVPGIYDISNDQYHSGAGISRSGIMEFNRSPQHYWERYLNPKRAAVQQTKEMEFGSAFHIYTLERHLFKQHVSIVPDVDRRTTKGKADWAMHQAQSFGKILLEDVDFQHIYNMHESVMSNATARSLIVNGQYERSIYYTDHDSNTLCKARPDILHRHFISDLKTSKNASFRGFQYDMVEYGYHIQAAMMFDAVEQVLKTAMKEFVFIVVEKLPPYAVAIYPIDIESIEIGRQIYRRKLLEINECMKSNRWPSYEPRIVSLPAWAANNY